MIQNRTIKSFVLRAGRVSKRQQLALENWLSDYELLLTNTPWDFDVIFDRSAKTVIEIGFGMGQSLIEMALNKPEINFIGIEVHQAGIGSLVAGLHEHDIKNVRVVSGDAVEVLKHHILDEQLDGVQIFFPDPWPKKKHHKRRIIQPDFINLLVQKLKPDGYIHCATDWEHYAEHMLTVLNSNERLANQSIEGGFSNKPTDRPLTKFERRGIKLSHGIWDLVYHKVLA